MRLILSFALTFSLAGSLFAEDNSAGGLQIENSVNSESYGEAQTAGRYVSPFELVFLGYQGFLKPQGIPSYASFCQGISWGALKPLEVIAAAIEAGYLNASYSANSDYLIEFTMKVKNICS